VNPPGSAQFFLLQIRIAAVQQDGVDVAGDFQGLLDGGFIEDVNDLNQLDGWQSLACPPILREFHPLFNRIQEPDARQTGVVLPEVFEIGFFLTDRPGRLGRLRPYTLPLSHPPPQDERQDREAQQFVSQFDPGGATGRVEVSHQNQEPCGDTENDQRDEKTFPLVDRSAV